MPKSTDPLASPGNARRRGPVRVSIGLDFGTHGTKVAYLQYGAARRVRPLTFDHGLAGWPDFVMPAVGLIRSGQLVWGVEAARALDGSPWNKGIRRLKVLLAAVGDDRFADRELESQYRAELDAAGVDHDLWRPEHVMVAALALQMVEVQRLVGERYPGQTLIPEFTIPVPIDQVQHSRVFELYLRVAEAADGLVQADGTLACTPAALMEHAAERFGRASGSVGSERRVFVIPEAVAQVASYVNSLTAEKGIHAIVDIGAGTTDISIFHLYEVPLAQHPSLWYGALAIPKAASYVLTEVLGATNHPGSLTEVELLALCAEHPQVCAAVLERVRHAMNPAWSKAHREKMKKQSAWESCPIFLCGGGAALPEARGVFSKCWVPNWPAHQMRVLPTPHDYEKGAAPFERMSVAYGLAIPGPEHGYDGEGGGPILPNDAPDYTPAITHRIVDDGGYDQMTPNWRW